jgi:serine/threonine-protein kinase
MGAAYRATDTKLNRGVAADPDRLGRFTREAQVLASLNHPNIAGSMALVMELVEGAQPRATLRRYIVRW